MASARPTSGKALSSAKALVVSLTAASEPTSQCETRSVRAPAYKKARARPDNDSAPRRVLAVLQADRTTQSALSLSSVTSGAVKRPSSSSVACSGSVNTNAGSASTFSREESFPGNSPCVAKCTTRARASVPLRFSRLTSLSVDAAPSRISLSPAPRLLATHLSSKAVSGNEETAPTPDPPSPTMAGNLT